MKNYFNALPLLLGALVVSPVVNATTPLWFEVEVVLFERLGETTKEKFVDVIKQFNIENSIKLQDDTLYSKLDLCPALTQFERFNLISTQKQTDDEESVEAQKLITDISLVDTDVASDDLAKEETIEIAVVECTAPDDSVLQQAYEILQTRITAAEQLITDNDSATDTDNNSKVSLIQTSSLQSLVQETTVDNESALSEPFNPNIFVPYPQNFVFNGVEYSSNPRVIIKKVPTVIAKVIEPVLPIENSDEVLTLKTETNKTTDELPTLIHTPERPYLLDKSRLEMTELVQKFRWQKTSKPLLHIGWRQPMVARELAIPIHLFAGKDYSDEYDNKGNNKALILEAEKQAALLNSDIALDETVELDEFQRDVQGELQQIAQTPSTSITDIIAEINTNDSVIETKPLWQLDGLLKIYLNHFLFIEPNFDFRKLEQVKVLPENTINIDTKAVLNISEQETALIDKEPTYISKLTSHPMSQHRRVRSKEVHYFDHPNMGMIIQIRRFEIPEEEEQK